MRSLGVEGSRVDQLAQLGRRDAAVARHVLDELAVKTGEKLLKVLPCRCCHARFGEGVGRALVFVALAAFHVHAELVEAALEERRLHGETGHGETAARLEPNLVECGGEVEIGEVIAAAQRFGEPYGELALAAEARNRLSQFLDARETRRLVADLDIKADDPRILGCLP